MRHTLPCAVRDARAALTVLSILIVAALGLASPARADSLDPPQLTAPAAGVEIKSNPVFTWSPVARASKYRIQVSTSPTFSSITWTADIVGTTATPTTELPIGLLHWRVAAFDGSPVRVQGPYSEAVTFERKQADAPQLAAPANGATLVYPSDPAVLSWNPVVGMKQYRVELDDEQTFTNPSFYLTAATSLALPLALPSNAPRYWRVQGISTTASVTTAWSSETDLRSFSIAWPGTAKPIPLTPADDIATDVDEIEFTWTPVPGAAKYEIQTSASEDFTTNLTTQVTGGTRYRPTTTMTQDQYYWRVRALQANNEPTAWSSVSRFKREWLDAQGLQARPAVTLADADPLVAGTQLEQDRISVSWTPVPRASYYEIEISTDPTFLAASTTTSMVRRTCKTPHTSWTPYLAGTYTGTTGFSACAWTGTPTSATATRFIIPGNTYYVRVRAIDQTANNLTVTTLWSNASREDEGLAPAPVSFTTFVPAAGSRVTTDPTQPAVPLASADSAAAPKLTWQPVEGAQAYLLALARDSSFNSRVLTPGTYVVTTNTEFQLNQVLLDNSAGQPYFWFVLPCTRWDGETDADNVCTVGENQAINISGYYASFNKLGRAVEGLNADAANDTVALSWQDQLATSPAGGGVKWYEVEVRNAANELVDTVKTDAIGYSPMDESYADGPHTWRARAIDAANVGLAWSAAGPDATFQKASSVPVPQATPATGTLPVLRWTATAYAGSYDVEIYRGVDPSFPSINRVGVAGAGATGRKYTAWVPTAALEADTYSWRVRQLDAYGRPGPWSTEVLPFTVGGTKPPLVAPANGASVPVTQHAYTWSPVPGAVRYRLETSATPGFGALTETATTPGTAYGSTVAYAGGATYYWRVSALNAADNILATSDPRSFVALTAPSAPTVTAARAGSTINVAWSQPNTGGTPITGYVVRHRVSGTTTWTEAAKAGDVTSAALDGLAPNQKYEAQVIPQNAVGAGLFSAVVSATIPPVPAAPTNLALTKVTGGLKATWTAPVTPAGGSPVTGYVVRVTPSAGGTPTETNVTTTSATMTGLQAATAYTVDVAAVNDVGRGAFVSAEATTGGTTTTTTPTTDPTTTPTTSTTPSTTTTTTTTTPTTTTAPVLSAPPLATVTPVVTPTPAPAKCRVPRLKGKTRAAAKRALLRARCGLGRVRGVRGGVVRTQSVRPGSIRPAGTKVALRLRPRS